MRHPLFDLEKVEHALAKDGTFTAGGFMTVDTMKNMDAMKALTCEVLQKRLQVFIEDKTFIVEPPKKRTTHAQRRKKREAPAASSTMVESATDKIAKKVSVILTPWPRRVGESEGEGAIRSSAEAATSRPSRAAPSEALSAWPQAAPKANSSTPCPKGSWATGFPTLHPRPRPWVRLEMLAIAPPRSSPKPCPPLVPPPGLSPDPHPARLEVVSPATFPDAVAVRTQDVARLLRSLASVIHPRPSLAPGPIRILQTSARASDVGQSSSAFFDEI